MPRSLDVLGFTGLAKGIVGRPSPPPTAPAAAWGLAGPHSYCLPNEVFLTVYMKGKGGGGGVVCPRTIFMILGSTTARHVSMTANFAVDDLHTCTVQVADVRGDTGSPRTPGASGRPPA